MKPKTAPTSPKYPLEQPHDVEKVWTHAPMVPPARMPIASVMVLSFLASLVTMAVALGGLVWFAWAHPNNAIVKALPSSVTTIIQSVPTSNKDQAPDVVVKSADSVVSLVPATTNAVTNDMVVGQGVILGSSGWIWTLHGSLPSGSSVSVANANAAFTTSTSLSDVLSSAVFLKSTLTTGQAMDMADTTKLADGQRVWVISRRLQTTAITLRHLRSLGVQGWQTCERFSPTWNLDQPIADQAGGVVVNDKGQAIGLLDAQGAIQLSGIVQPLFDGVISRGSIDRPACGFRLTTSAAALVPNTSGAVVWVVGATGSDQSVTSKGPADQAGLKSGDRITQIDGQNVGADPGTFFRSLRLGQHVQLTVTRGGKTVPLNLTIGVAKE